LPSFSKNSLEELRQRIDLVEILSPHVRFQNAGASFKALCPFHDEKTPSFVIQKGDKHYHCFGCGAHGDAIQFMMSYLKLSFQESVETLAEKFGVPLEVKNEYEGPSKALLKDALEKSARFYHFCLLHTDEGREALGYLYNRGIDLDFIKTYRLGFAPRSQLFQDYMRTKEVNDFLLDQTGLIKTVQGRKRDFFHSRIMIPILDVMGSVIGFSARKTSEETYGPKYINTPETQLFKKSKVLFGLNYSRKKIAKEGKALIVEGQFDALRLIYSGFSMTVASQGTAFSEDHAQALISLGVKFVYVAFDSDAAGVTAAEKVGHLFQKHGIDVNIISIPDKSDPDQILMQKGPEYWIKLMEESTDYLNFLIDKYTKEINPKTPAQKTELVTTIAKRIREWDHPLMVHESLRKLARLTNTPEQMIGIDVEVPAVSYKRSASVTHQSIDPDRVLEADLLRWIFLAGESKPELLELARKNLKPEHFKISCCKRIFVKYFEALDLDKPRDLLAFTMDLEKAEDQLFLSEMLQKRINLERAKDCFFETVKQILEKRWMERREEIKDKILNGKLSEAEVMELAKEFDQLKKQKPKIVEVESSNSLS